MINKAQVLGKDIVQFTSIPTNENNPGNEVDFFMSSTYAKSKTRDIKVVKPQVLRDWLLSSITIPSTNYNLQTNSVITYINSSTTFSIQFMRNSQIAYVKSTNGYGVVEGSRYIIPVTIKNSSGTVLGTVSIPPKCSVEISLDKNNVLKVKTLCSTLLPIGSIYYTYDKTNPSNIFPGTSWDLMTSEVFNYMSSIRSTTVSGEDFHTLTREEVTDHKHLFNHTHTWTQFSDRGYPDGATDRENNTNRNYMHRGSNGARVSTLGVSTSEGFYTGGFSSNTSSSCSSGAHENKPQYITAFCWRRIS